MKKNIFMLVFAVLAHMSLNANNISNCFNHLPVSPALVGTSGNYYLIQKGISAKWVNPAGTYTSGRDLYFSHLDYLSDVKAENLAASFYLQKMKLQLTAGFSYRYASDTKFTSVHDTVYKVFNAMSLYTTVFDIGVSYRIGRNFYLGMLYKNLQTKIADVSAGVSYFDAGIVLDKFLGEFNLGMSVRNILSKNIDKSISLRIPLLSFFDVMLGYNSDESIGGFNASGVLSVKDFLRFGAAYSKEHLKYSAIFIYENLYEVALSTQFTDIDMVALLSIDIKI